MKSIQLIVLLLTFSTTLLSQQLNEKDLIGSWEVVNVQVIPEFQMTLDEAGIQKMELLRTGFTGVVYNFKENSAFTIKFPENIPEFMKELEFLNNKKWKLDEREVIVVGTEQDNYSLLGMKLISKEGKKFFISEESPLIMEVTKQ